MKLYWSPQTRSTRAIWMLEEAGVDYISVTAGWQESIVPVIEAPS